MRRCWLRVVITCALVIAGGVRADGLDEKIALCKSCHGQAGLPVQPGIPIIFGQEFYYLYVQLKDYKSGLRANPVMSGVAATLSKEEMQGLAEHFSKQAWPSIGYSASQTDIDIAQAETAAGMCSQCHSGYTGNSSIPRVAGQQPAYLERTMLNFKNKIRLNSPAKGSLFAAYDDEQIGAIARYLAGY